VAIQTLYNIKLVDNKRRFEAHEPEMNDLSTTRFQLLTEMPETTTRTADSQQPKSHFFRALACKKAMN
jgi:hypothetical protein